MDRGLGIKLGAPVASPRLLSSLISRLRDEDNSHWREMACGPRRQGERSAQLTCYYVSLVTISEQIGLDQ